MDFELTLNFVSYLGLYWLEIESFCKKLYAIIRISAYSELISHFLRAFNSIEVIQHFQYLRLIRKTK